MGTPNYFQGAHVRILNRKKEAANRNISFEVMYELLPGKGPYITIRCQKMHSLNLRMVMAESC